MSAFHFVEYGYNEAEKEAFFAYRYGAHTFRETMRFETVDEQYAVEVFDRALFLAFLTIGTSYYKSFPVKQLVFEMGELDQWQADFCTTVYQDGLGQYIYENNLTRADMAVFTPTVEVAKEAVAYDAKGIVCMQSGGKDSLLLADMLTQAKKPYTAWYMQQGNTHPGILDTLGAPLHISHRAIDKKALARAAEHGAKNGHVPVTFIALSYALLQAVLTNANSVLTAIGHEGEEPHAIIGDLAVTHQWSKTWRAEKLFAEYVQRYISPDISVGSPLRSLSELEICELFAKHSWQRYRQQFSSCNVANYQQGANNADLEWCSDCPKCANSFLLFAPFVPKGELLETFGGSLFEDPELHEDFKGLLGVGDAFKPFECVAEQDELRWAYAAALQAGHTPLPFSVDPPRANFDPHKRYPCQEKLAQGVL